MVKSSPGVSPKPRFGPNLDLTVCVSIERGGAFTAVVGLRVRMGCGRGRSLPEKARSPPRSLSRRYYPAKDV